MPLEVEKLPLFQIKCSNEKCGFEKEKLCSHDTAKAGIPCDKCEGIMTLQVSKNGGFKIFGYSMDNGYSKDNLSYDGNPNPTW